MFLDLVSFLIWIFHVMYAPIESRWFNLPSANVLCEKIDIFCDIVHKVELQKT